MFISAEKKMIVGKIQNATVRSGGDIRPMYVSVVFSPVVVFTVVISWASTVWNRNSDPCSEKLINVATLWFTTLKNISPTEGESTMRPNRI